MKQHVVARIATLLALACALVALASCQETASQRPQRTLTPPRATAAATATITQGAQGKVMYFGVSYAAAPLVGPLYQYEDEMHKRVSLILWYENWERDGTSLAFPSLEMQAIREDGAIPVLAWQPQATTNGLPNEDVTLPSIIDGTWDSYISAFAAAAAAWGHPFFLRFASEMNGDWTPWFEQAPGNAPGEFVLAWRHVHDLFVRAGARNATWVWCPNIETANTIPYEELYPGNDYVDWVGLDGYNYGTAVPSGHWETFNQVFRGSYLHLLKVTHATLPFMIGETGTVEQGGSKVEWITDALTNQLPQHYMHVFALIWFDESISGLDLRFDTSTQSLGAFRAAIAPYTYATNVFATSNVSPIPPLCGGPTTSVPTPCS